MKKSRFISILVLFAVLIGVITAVVTVSYAESKNMPEASSVGQEVDVWLIAGQSNAVGYGEIAKYPSEYAADKALLQATSDNVFIYKVGEGENFTDGFVSCGFGYGKSSATSGAELGIVTSLNGNGRMNAIIKVGHGNTSLHNNTTSNESVKYGTWTSPSYIEEKDCRVSGNKTGDFYYRLLDSVAYGLDELVAKGYTPVIKGMWWMQGEADTFGTTSSADYQKLLTYFIKDVRVGLSEVSGVSQAEMPFVFGRLYRNPNYADTAYLTVVQEKQDAVASDKSLKNVFMVDMRTDLIDPLTADTSSPKTVLPAQQDGWHFNAITQQMIGEAFIRKVASVTGEKTKYGIIPSSDTSPFAVFKNLSGAYEYDGGFSTYKSAMERAIALADASSGVTDDAVVLMRKNYSGTDYPDGISWIGGRVTLDLGGHTLAAHVSMGNTQLKDVLDSDGNAPTATFNIKNGTLLMRDFGVVFAAVAKDSSYTKEKTVEYSLENLKIGFSDTSSVTDSAKGIDLLVSDRSSYSNLPVKYRLTLRACELDMVTNAKSDADLGRLKTFNMTDVGKSNYEISFEDCTFKVDNTAKLGFEVSESGSDSVTFVKGKSGRYSKILATGALDTITLAGNDDGKAVSLTLGTAADEGSLKAYYPTASLGVSTPYGIIPAEYADSAKYPFVIFKKQNASDSSYTFVSDVGYSSFSENAYWEKTCLAAISLTSAASEGRAAEAVILLRRDYSTTAFPTGTSDIGTVVTLDLAAHTFTAINSLCNTGTKDCLANGEALDSVMNVKNGSLLMGKHGVIYAAMPSGATYTKEKALTVNFTDVYIGFAEGATSKTLLDSAYNFPISSNARFNLNFDGCTFDMSTNLPDGAVLGRLQTASESASACYNDHTVTIGANCVLIGDSAANLVFQTSADGDRVIFKKNSSGGYAKVLLGYAEAEPEANPYSFEGEGGKLTYYENRKIEGVYKVYELHPAVETSYGLISYRDAANDFGVFVKTASGYEFYKSYGGWKLAFEACTTLTDGSSDAYSEAVAVLLNDSVENGIPYYASEIASTVVLDLNGNTLTVGGSFFNSSLDDSNSSVGNIEIKNGTLLTSKYGLVYTAPLDGGSYTSPKTLNLRFTDTYIGFASGRTSDYYNLLAHAQNGSATVNAAYNMSFTDCTIDLYNNSDSSVKLGRAKGNVSAVSATNTLDFALSFKNCEFLIHDPAQLAFSSSSAEGDSITFERCEDGTYSSVKLASVSKPAENLGAFVGSFGESLALTCKGESSGGFYLCDMTGPETLPFDSTPYGDIPYAYMDKTRYPFAVFAKNADSFKFVAGYANYRSAMEKCTELTHVKTGSVSEALILLRADFENTDGDYAENMARIGGTITLDLGGNTLTEKTSMGNTGTVDCLDSGGNAKKATLNFRNGNLVMRDFGIIFNSTASGSYTKEKVFDYNIENVKMSFYPGNTNKTEAYKYIDLLVSDRKAHTGARVTFNLNVTDCTFDLTTNSRGGDEVGKYAVLGTLITSNTSGHVDVGTSDYNIVFNGCSFIANEEKNAGFIMSESGDTVSYKKNEDGKYATLTLPKNAPAPSGLYCIEEGLGVYSATILGTDTVTYELRPIELSDIGISPQAEFELEKGLTMSVCFAALDSITDIKLDGVKLDSAALQKENGSYVINIPLASSSAAKEVRLSISAKVPGTDTSVSEVFSFDIVTYCKDMLDGILSDEQRQLYLDTLSYIRAAYTYFASYNTEEVISDVCGRITEILGTDYDESSLPEEEGSTNSSAVGLSSVMLVLGAEPTLRFYLESGYFADMFEFSVDGEDARIGSGIDTNGTYVDVYLYAYECASTVSYTVGTYSGSYHIESYCDFVKTDDVHKGNSALIEIAERFLKYCQSAEAYQNSK